MSEHRSQACRCSSKAGLQLPGNLLLWMLGSTWSLQDALCIICALFGPSSSLTALVLMPALKATGLTDRADDQSWSRKTGRSHCGDCFLQAAQSVLRTALSCAGCVFQVAGSAGHLYPTMLQRAAHGPVQPAHTACLWSFPARGNSRGGCACQVLECENTIQKMEPRMQRLWLSSPTFQMRAQ